MIASVRRALPGVFFSLLLAAPLSTQALAGTTADTSREHHARPAARHPAARKRVVRPALHTTSLRTEVAPAGHAPWHQSGIASWYGGKRWQGHRTASGARYDENALTAAHATLPIGSRVRVVDTRTGRSVVVTINDRPGTRTRIIDLSRGAAEALGILRRGIARVTLLPG